MKASIARRRASARPSVGSALRRSNVVVVRRGAAPDLIPFPYGLVMTKPETCQTKAEKCARVVRALAAANRMIHNEPEKALGILSARFKTMDPGLLYEPPFTSLATAGPETLFPDADVDSLIAAIRAVRENACPAGQAA